jgi:hypothetical protein
MLIIVPGGTQEANFHIVVHEGTCLNLFTTYEVTSLDVNLITPQR